MALRECPERYYQKPDSKGQQRPGGNPQEYRRAFKAPGTTVKLKY